jgi:hypothetical protein
MGVACVAVEQVIGVLLITVVAAAAGTLIPYAVDEVLEHKNLIRDVEDYDQALKE